MTKINNLIYLVLVMLLTCCITQDKNNRISQLNPTVQPTVPTRNLISDSAIITPVPTKLGYNKFYKKYLSANGIPVVSSDRVPDQALIQARNIIIQMLARIPHIYAVLIKNKVRVAVMSVDEVTTDIPEHSDLSPRTYWDRRARGLGATLIRPATSCAEENLLCYDDDPYEGEDILIHEFAHTIHQLGLSLTVSNFDEELEDCYAEAKRKGLWRDTYAISNPEEYFAEGVQSWFNLNREAIPADGIHNEINTLSELQEYDTMLFNLISQYFFEDDYVVSCQAN